VSARTSNAERRVVDASCSRRATDEGTPDTAMSGAESMGDGPTEIAPRRRVYDARELREQPGPRDDGIGESAPSCAAPAMSGIGNGGRTAQSCGNRIFLATKRSSHVRS